MTRSLVRVVAALALPALALLVSGCAGWQQTLAKGSVTPLRKDRQEEAIREFEQHRNAAQLEAALDRWQQGDAAGCESRLAALVQRWPDYADARLHLAELLWSRGDAAAAEPHLQAVVQAHPERADAHHTLGLLLDATGRRDQALQHFARAAELEPENDVYRLTRESLAAAP
jgi:Flp pilus assembly protein TadD